MKKLMSILLSAALLISLAACGGTPNAADPTPMPTATPTPEQSTPKEPSAPADDTNGDAAGDGNGKVLVVYFSAQNHTEAVAQTIADHMDADIFELIPTQPYTEDGLNWRNDSSRVNAEHEDEALRDIPLEADTVENWEDYDTVLVGYPIWWSIAAWPMNNFIKSNNFTGKTVIPFCTHGGSGWAGTPATIARLEPNANILEGLSISRDVIDGARQELVTWVNGLDI